MADFPETDGILAAISSVASAVLTWVVARRKNNAEATRSELDNVEQAIKIWRQIADGQQEQIKKQDEEIKNLRHELRNVRNQVDGLYRIISHQNLVNEKLVNALTELGVNAKDILDEEDIPPVTPTLKP